MPIVSAFDQNGRTHNFDQFERCSFRKDDYEIDCRERGKNPCPTLFIHKWPPCLEASYWGITIQTDHQPITCSTCFFEKFYMTGMHEIEATVRKADLEPLATPFIEPFFKSSLIG